MNISEELTKLIKLIDDKTFDIFKFSIKKNLNYNTKTDFLRLVLMLTIKYPQVELYLENLLHRYTINELNNIEDWSILHYMSNKPSNISLNAFEIIINYGINVNIKDSYGYTAAHTLLSNKCNNHIYNILNLLIKHSTNLNIINKFGETVLDVVIDCQKNLTEETKKCIMALVDCNGTNVRIYDDIIDDIIYNFIQHYKCSTIKPAIKK